MSDALSEYFNELCVENHVEVTVKPLPNPGSPFRAIKMLEFRSFNDVTVRVTQYDRKQTTHYIPANGTIQMILGPDEPLPNIERITE